jgi:uncharacterized protein
LNYIDTSILVAYYCPEPLSRASEQVIRSSVLPGISDLTEVEFTATLARKARNAEIERLTAELIARQFTEHVEGGFYQRVELSRRYYLQARKLITACTTPLRTLDALHLSIASLHGWQMITADSALARAATEIGLKTRLLRVK